MDINTPEDWWALFDNCKIDIVKILYDNIDMTYVGFENNPKLYDNGHLLTEALLNRDHETLIRIMNVAWWNAPEAYCWSVPNWGSFCNLMSEEWVFYETQS